MKNAIKQQHKLSYQVVNSAEQAKIALSDKNEHDIQLDSIDSGLSVAVDRNSLRQANNRQLANIANLMQEAVKTAGCKPDIIFVTGGTAKSPVLSQFIQAQFPGQTLVVGDHFGSVTAGLTRWAEKIFS